MLTVFLKIAAIFAMTAIGFAASKTGILPAESKKYLSNLLLFITSPCMIIGSMTSQTLDAHTFELMIQIVAGSFVFFIAAMGISFLIVKLMRCDRDDAGVLMVIITAVNTGFMGFPVTKAIFGNTYFFLMVIQNIVLNIYLYSMMVYQMNYGFRKKEGIKGMLMPMLNMCTYALIIGMVLMLLKVQLPDILADFINTIGDATIPVSMIVVGVQHFRKQHSQNAYKQTAYYSKPLQCDTYTCAHIPCGKLAASGAGIQAYTHIRGSISMCGGKHGNSPQREQKRGAYGRGRGNDYTAFHGYTSCGGNPAYAALSVELQ